MENKISSEIQEMIKQSLANKDSLPIINEDDLRPSADNETSLTGFLTEERNMQVRRFYLSYPAKDKEGNDLHLYIEIEVDDEDSSYLNYWVGCEEYTAKRYIASVQGDLKGQNLLEIVKVKHIYYYIHEVRENFSYSEKA